MRYRYCLYLLLLTVQPAGCADQTPLAGHQGAEDAALVAIAEAFKLDDCEHVLALGTGFTTTSVLRYDTVTTWVGRCQYRAGSYPQAEQTLAMSAYREPANRATPDALYFTGRSRYRQDRWEEAGSDFIRFRQRFPHHFRQDNAHYWLGRALTQRGLTDEAVATFDALLADRDASASRKSAAWYRSGRIFVDLAASSDTPAEQSWEEAARRFETVLTDYADSRWADNAALQLARLPYRRGEWQVAEELLTTFLENWPLSSLRYAADWTRARAVEEQGDRDRAIALYEAHENTYADHAYADNARYRRGRVMAEAALDAAGAAAEMGDPLDAPEVVDKLTAAETVLAGFADDWPESSLLPGVSWFLGRVRYELSSFSAALSAFSITVATPSSVFFDNALYYTGRCHYRIAFRGEPQRYEDAIAAFERLVHEAPDSIYADNADYFRARALYELGRMQEAEHGFDAFPIDHPTSPYVDNAYYWLVRTRLALQDCVGALHALAELQATDEPTWQDAALALLSDTGCSQEAP